MGGSLDLVFGLLNKLLLSGSSKLFLLNQQQLPIMVVIVGAAASAAIIFFLFCLIFFILPINNKKKSQQQGTATWKQDITSSKRDLELNHPLSHSTYDKNQSADVVDITPSHDVPTKSCLLINIMIQEKHTKDLVVVSSKPSSKTAVTSPESGGNEASNRTVAGNETQSPSPPLKVRKEKLGDRITTLQQLVSPFGKTDTASVLLETIGYIKFLHEMVHNLSTQHMKPGVAMHHRHHQKLENSKLDNHDDEQGPKHNLRSRGLCLVPLSSTYAVTAS